MLALCTSIYLHVTIGFLVNFFLFFYKFLCATYWYFSLQWAPTRGIATAVCQFKVMYFMNLIFYKFLQYCLGSTASKIQFHLSAPTNTGKVSTLPLQISFSYPHWRAISVKSCCVCIRSRKLAGRTGQEILWKAAGKANVWQVHVTVSALLNELYA